MTTSAIPNSSHAIVAPYDSSWNVKNVWYRFRLKKSVVPPGSPVPFFRTSGTRKYWSTSITPRIRV